MPHTSDNDARPRPAGKPERPRHAEDAPLPRAVHVSRAAGCLVLAAMLTTGLAFAVIAWLDSA
ncbi:MAG: hypothetical protein AAFP26_08525 [Planctomycetota bacterium]